MTQEEIIQHYSPMVYRLAFARVGTRYDADDIYEEVFLRYLRRPVFESEEHGSGTGRRLPRKFLLSRKRIRICTGNCSSCRKSTAV